jgi:hypothetical protein
LWLLVVVVVVVIVTVEMGVAVVVVQAVIERELSHLIQLFLIQ